MAQKKPVTVAGLARANVDPALVQALADSIERLAAKALPALWGEVLLDYGILCNAQAGGVLFPADFAQFINRYTEAAYDFGEAEAAAAETAQAGKSSPSPKKGKRS